MQELRYILNIIGMVESNLMGTIILAFSLNNVIKAINNSILALELSQTTNVTFTRLDKHRFSANKNSTLYVKIGFVFIGFVFQIITLAI